MTTPLDIATLCKRVATTRWLAGLCTAMLAVTLSACGGGGSTHNPFTPTKVIAMGDNLAVTTNAARYSVNLTTGEVLTMVEQVAVSYGVSTTTAFVSAAQPNARVASTTSFAPAATPLSTQVSSYGAIGATDMFILSAGTVDIVDEFLYGTGSKTSNVQNAARNFSSVVQSLVAKGAKRIIVVPPYDLSITPWGKSLSAADQTTLKGLVTAFRDTFKAQLALSGVDGRVVVYADIELQMNLVVNSNSLSLSDVVTPICDITSSAKDTTNGIGIGTNEVNSSKCDANTLISVSSSSGTVTATVSAYAFADKLYPTPVVHRDLGASIYSASAGR
jgi:outer membrane lipase/esterase